jgi:Leucine-rich repeat (LRR) protein
MPKILTLEMISSKCKTKDYKSITQINFWGCEIEDISILSELPNLEKVSLSLNKINDLQVFNEMNNLKELYLRGNLIDNFEQIENLKNCFNLKILNLSENPISQQNDYKNKIQEILPNLWKLDDVILNLITLFFYNDVS